MARPKSETPNLERALRLVVEETIQKHLARLSHGRPIGEELKEVRGTVARIERRLEALGQKVGGTRRNRPAGTGSPGRPPLYVGCKVEGCTAEHYALGLCSKHYQQSRRGKLQAASKRALGKKSRGTKAGAAKKTGSKARRARSAAAVPAQA